MSFVVYMVKCSDETLYVGSTSDIKRRLHQHNYLKSGAHYTKIRRPVDLVYSEICPSLSEARKREYALKSLTREEKLKIIMGC